MKAVLRLPTKHQFAFIEMHYEGDEVTEIYDKYNEWMALIQAPQGLKDPEFNRVLDEYLWGSGTMTADEYATMNADQGNLIQCIKRSRARHKAKTQ